MEKLLFLTLNEQEEKAVEKVIAALSDSIQIGTIQPSPILSFLGLEIRLHQRRVLKGGAYISLTRLEYNTLCHLVARPGRVFTRE